MIGPTDLQAIRKVYWETKPVFDTYDIYTNIKISNHKQIFTKLFHHLQIDISYIDPELDEELKLKERNK